MKQKNRLYVSTYSILVIVVVFTVEVVGIIVFVMVTVDGIIVVMEVSTEIGTDGKELVIDDYRKHVN